MNKEAVLRELEKLPLEADINYQGECIGFVSLNFELSRKNNIKIGGYEYYEIIFCFLSHFVWDFYKYIEKIENEFELLLEIKKRMSPEEDLLFRIFGEANQEFSYLNNRLKGEKALIISLIETYGSEFLTNFGVQAVITDCIANKNSRYIKKICDALLKNMNPQGLPIKVGRPRKRSEQMDILTICVYYRTLKILQKMQKSNKRDFLATAKTVPLNWDFLERLKLFLRPPLHQEPELFDEHIFENSIKIDKEILEEINSNWTPHQLAKKITSKVTGYSPDSIKKILPKLK